jgi:hypothetical protein
VLPPTGITDKAMSMPMNEKLIFVSHSGEDTWVALQIARQIESCGARPFLDKADIDVGSDFEEDIRQFLDKADELLVLFTPWSLERPYVWAEIGAAWIRKIPIIVVLHGLSIPQFQAQPNYPVFIKKRDIIHLNDIDQYFQQLGARVAQESKKNV